MKALIRNLTGNPISLPAPYAGVIAGGGGTVIDIGASTPDAFAAQYIDLFGGPNVVSISEMPGESPIGQITPASTASGIATALAASTAAVSVNGQKITNLGAPTANTDAATKLYVDTHGGGGGTPSAPLTSVQFNDGGAFGGDATLEFNKTSKTLAAKNVALAGTLKNSIDFSTGANQTISAGGTIGPADKIVWGIDAAGAVSTSTVNPIALLTAADYGRVLWLINIGPNTITLKAGGTTLLDGGVDLAMPTATVAKFMFIQGPGGDAWVQTDKAITAG